jgi:hypothetical protein
VLSTAARVFGIHRVWVQQHGTSVVLNPANHQPMTDIRMGGAQLEALPAMTQGVYSEDTVAQLQCTTDFRKLLSIGAPLPPHRHQAPVLVCRQHPGGSAGGGYAVMWHGWLT